MQHQLAEAQRELAHKDEEVAASVEKRLEVQAAYEVLLEQQRETQQRINEADDYRARMAGVEERLAAATATADELRHQLERERTERAAMMVQFDEANAAFERARNLWRDETSVIDEQHAAQLAQLDQQKRAAVDAAEAARTAALDRQRETHEAELDALRTAHDRELAALRGELEPKVVEARGLAAEIERLGSELTAMTAEHRSLMSERIELHKWELQQQAEAHATELATAQRAHSAEMSRMSEEVLAANQAGQLIERNAALREQLWEQTVGALRESQKKLQHELAEAKELAAQVEAANASVEQRLTTTLESLDAVEAENRELREQIDAVETEARRNTIDRQRFAAYLEQGLAMLGAETPGEQRFERAVTTVVKRPTSPNERPTAQFEAIAEPPPVDLEMDAEAPPLPDPREPTRH